MFLSSDQSNSEKATAQTNQDTASKATPCQLPDFCSHIEHRLSRCIRLGRKKGMMDFEIQALVALKTGQEF